MKTHARTEHRLGAIQLFHTYEKKQAAAVLTWSQNEPCRTYVKEMRNQMQRETSGKENLKKRTTATAKGARSPAKPAGRHMGSHCLKVTRCGFASASRVTSCDRLEALVDGHSTTSTPSLPSLAAASIRGLLPSSATTFPVSIVQTSRKKRAGIQ